MPEQKGPAPEGHAPDPPSKKTLLIVTAVAAAVGALVVFGAVLPAEYNRDPLGIGKATGLSRLWAPREVEVAAVEGDQPLARDYATPYRTDVIEIPLATGDAYFERTNEIEYKVRMQQGATLIYSLVAEGLDLPDELYYDFHGHTLVPEGSDAEMTVSTYKQASEPQAHGALVALFDGIHGWYLQNSSLPPITVRLRLAGFYELIPPGQEGNLGSILPLDTERLRPPT